MKLARLYMDDHVSQVQLGSHPAFHLVGDHVRLPDLGGRIDQDGQLGEALTGTPPRADLGYAFHTLDG